MWDINSWSLQLRTRAKRQHSSAGTQGDGRTGSVHLHQSHRTTIAQERLVCPQAVVQATGLNCSDPQHLAEEVDDPRDGRLLVRIQEEERQLPVGVERQ
jgi:hypothetical protein